MRRILRLIGLILVIASLVVLFQDYSADADRRSVGDLWYQLHAPSLNALQAGIQRRLDPSYWDSIMVPFLLWPAHVVLLVVGAVLFLIPGRRNNAG